ncbi:MULTISPECIES: GNAT family N-acetyltransferase [Rhizobiaceae]|uniref:GNAT family N-acetyltransferase n=1 Tax=Rhizobiaceae TaxID=82115 RepID=UPI00083CB5F3|nr:GNAT family N-acetyltransferase [Sinorhizobium sp. RAC02]AOF92256.1 acetyltransferase family protein [Sinorhizobium sp. RAC02]
MSKIVGARLYLARCTSDDRSDFLALEQDAEVMRYLNGGAVDHSRTDPDHVEFLMPRGDESFVWTARSQPNAAFIGWFSLFPQSDTVAEIGFRLCRRQWGSGLATEGAALLLAWGFEQGGYKTVLGTTMTVNQRSRRVLEKIGMTHIGTDHLAYRHPIPGSEQGDVRYELTSSIWRSQVSQGSASVS